MKCSSGPRPMSRHLLRSRVWDYVWISYYEDDRNGLKPNPVAAGVRQAARDVPQFPRSGFGKWVLRKAKKTDALTRYYTMKITTPELRGRSLLGGNRQDMVPVTKELWTTLNTAIKAAARWSVKPPRFPAPAKSRGWETF